MNDVVELVPEIEEPVRQSIFDICETDGEAEENGKWFNDVFEDGSDIAVKLRRMTSKKSTTVRRRLEKQFKNHQKRDGTWDEDIAEKMVLRQMVEAVIVDWKNIIDRDGSVIEHSIESAEMLIGRLPAFRDLLINLSIDMDNYRMAAVEDAAKN